MIGALFPLLRPLIGRLDAETAHDLTIRALAALPVREPAPDDSRLAVEAFGLRFPNPVGLAAGFDKQADVADAMLALGFGSVEIGGVLPRPQAGNPSPRVFRLPRDGAVINRYGLNTKGLPAVRERLVARRHRPGIVGANIGANKDSADRLADYAICMEGLADLVSFVTVNVSSPNTPGLRDLQGEAFLDDILGRVTEIRDRVADRLSRRTPVLLKIAPDIGLEGLDAIVKTALRRGIDGLVIANTTIARPATLRETTLAREAGGLSGRPLFGMSTRMLAQAYLRVEGRMPLIGVGGIEDAETAWTKIEAGASLLQLYTALIYRGPGLVGEIKRGLVERLAREGHPSLSPVVGRRAAELAAA